MTNRILLLKPYFLILYLYAVIYIFDINIVYILVSHYDFILTYCLIDKKKFKLEMRGGAIG